jgi:hypothetical protein
MVESRQPPVAEGNGISGTGMGSTLYNEIYRLIAEWYGSDADRQTSSIPQLVDKLVQLQEADGRAVAQAAASADAEAA